jgi:hypothetical protein
LGGEKLNRKSLLLIFSVIALSAIMIVSAALVYTLNSTQQTIVPPLGSVTITIDTTTYNTGQTWDYTWLNPSIGTPNVKSITINNLYNTIVTPAIVATGLPTGWTLTLSSTDPIAAGASVQRDVVLTIPSGTAAGPYSWSAQITASTA